MNSGMCPVALHQSDIRSALNSFPAFSSQAPNRFRDHKNAAWLSWMGVRHEAAMGIQGQ